MAPQKGLSVLAVLLAGYLAQHYLPPPKPRIVGIDLGTTYSCIGIYQAGSGQVHILKDKQGHSCIPSVVSFRGKDMLVGYEAAAQSDHNPQNTVYDAKRFIGKRFNLDELRNEAGRYPFKIFVDADNKPHYAVDWGLPDDPVTPEHVGSHVIRTLKQTAERNLSMPATLAVMSVPAEFTEAQRNSTRRAAELAGLEVLRIINEPTAAALAYGLHKKEGTNTVMVVDIGGGTLDVSLLLIQGGMFLTQAMSGNNHLGGQDFNERLLNYLLKHIRKEYNRPLTDPEDIQSLRLAVEDAKLNLTNHDSALIQIYLHSFKSKSSPLTGMRFEHEISREMFEDLNMDLFKKVLEPIRAVLDAAEMSRQDIDEIVLVGGSTRIPKVRQLIQDYFGKEPNVSIDPELAVVTGVSIQAGIMGGAWPLTVSAIEIRATPHKIQLH